MAANTLIVGTGTHELEVNSTYPIPVLVFSGFVPVDPASISLVLRDAETKFTTFTYPVGATLITRNATGNYTFTFSPSDIGRHVYTVTTTTPNLVSSGVFQVIQIGALI